MPPDRLLPKEPDCYVFFQYAHPYWPSMPEKVRIAPTQRSPWKEKQTQRAVPQCYKEQSVGTISGAVGPAPSMNGVLAIRATGQIVLYLEQRAALDIPRYH